MQTRTNLREQRWHTVESLIGAFGPELYRCLLQFFVDPTIAAEVWVETFTKAFVQAKKLSKWTSSGLWLATTVEEICRGRGLEIVLADLSWIGTQDTSSGPQLQARRSGDVAKGDAAKGDVKGEGEGADRGSVPVIPDPLWNRLHKRLLAMEALMGADQRRRGPVWTQFALGVTALLGIAAMTYGLSTSSHAAITPKSTPSADHLVAKLPAPLTNLPTTTVAQFEVQVGATPPSLAHASVSSHALYIPNMQLDKTGQQAISIDALPFSADGENWTSAAKTVGSLSLKPPGGHPRSSWHIASWDFDVTSHWAIASVSWASSGDSVIQLYGENLTTGRGGLMRTLTPRAGEATAYITAIGEDKVAVQPGITEGKGAAATVVGLPIQVYSVAGQSPVQALSKNTQVSGSFGLMQAPTLTKSGIVFQGIAGQSLSNSAIDATWYVLNWNGTLNKVQGPPLDNQPHWVVQSNTGQLWWAETTPDVTGQGNSVQVVMGPLSTGSSATSPTQTLSGPVTDFAVSGSHLIWSQTTSGVSQIVVSEVTP